MNIGPNKPVSDQDPNSQNRLQSSFDSISYRDSQRRYSCPSSRKSQSLSDLKSDLQIWQINCRMSRHALDCVAQDMLDHKTQILLISDPPSFIKSGGRLPGFKTILPSVERDLVKCALLISESLDCSSIFSNSGRVAGVKMQFNREWLTILSVYIQPSTGEGWSDLKRIFATLDAQNIMVAGDFNARSPLWGPPSTEHNANGTTLVEWMDSADLEMLNKWPCSPTFVSDTGTSSWIDCTLISGQAVSLVKSWNVIPLEERLTDHNLISTVLTQTDSDSHADANKFGVPNWRKADWLKICVQVHFEMKQKEWLDFDWSLVTSPSHMDSLVACFESDLFEIVKDLVPKSQNRGHRKPWWSLQIGFQRKTTRKAFRRFERHKSKPCAASLKQSALSERRKLRKMITDAKKEAWESFVTEGSEENLWNVFKKVTKKRSFPDLSFVKTLDEDIVSTPAEIMNALACKFFPEPVISDHSAAQELKEANDLWLDEHMCAEAPMTSLMEVQHAVFRGKQFGATGVDQLPNILFRKCFFSLGPCLVGMMNAVLRIQHIPKSWKTGKIVVVPKGEGNVDISVTKLRPISLLPALAKIFEALINERLIFHLECETKLNKNQHGFRRARSTSTALLSAVEEIEENTVQDRLTYCCSLDIKGAFDSVPAQQLISRAIQMNIPHYMTNILAAFVSKRTSLLSVQSQEKIFSVSNGTPQGSPLSPSLFVMFINPILSLNSDLPDTTIQAYADDLWLSASATHEVEAQHKLQMMLDRISCWLKNAGLSLSIEKCLSIRFMSCNPSTEMLPVFVNETKIPVGHMVKYLGVWLDNRLTFNAHVQHACRKAMNRLTLIRRMSKTFWGVDPAQMYTLVSRTVEPILYYACCCWCKITSRPAQLKPIDRILRKSALLISGGLSTTPYSSAFLLSGVLSSDIKIGSAVLRQARSFNALRDPSWNIAAEQVWRDSHFSSFRKCVEYEVRRSQRELGVADVFRAPQIVPFSISPINLNKLPMALLQSDAVAPETTTLCCIWSRLRADGVAWSWIIEGPSIQASRSGLLPQNACRKSAEMMALSEALSTLESERDALVSVSEKVVLVSRQDSVKTCLRMFKNVSANAAAVQTKLVKLFDDGVVIKWHSASNKPSDAIRHLISRSSQITNRSLIAAELPANSGWSWKSFKSWNRISLNRRMQKTFVWYPNGTALMETGIQFQMGSFPGKSFPRHSASTLSQFLANHFPGKKYLSRFHLLPEAVDEEIYIVSEHSRCVCGAPAEDRDHLLFDCPILDSARSELTAALGDSDLCWEACLANLPALSVFIRSIRSHWSSLGRRWG